MKISKSYSYEFNVDSFEKFNDPIKCCFIKTQILKGSHRELPVNI